MAYNLKMYPSGIKMKREGSTIKRIRILWSLCLIFSIGVSVAPAALQKPNVLLLLVDDLGYNDIAFRESAPADVKKIGTPGINRIAESGICFTDAYATAPICSPSRVGLMTGRYPQRWGNYWYGQGGLDPKEKTIAHYLKSAGYTSKMIGKVHLNGGPVEHPMDHGFDEFMGFITHTWDYKRLSQKDVAAYRAKGVDTPGGFGNGQMMGAFWRDRDPVGADYDGPEAFTTRIFTDEAVEYLERNHNHKPFFLTVSYNAMHMPTYVVDQEYAARLGVPYISWDRTADNWPWPYWEPTEMAQKAFHLKYGHMQQIIPDGRARYLSHLLALDDGVARIMDTLVARGLRENTLVIFVSDNGGTINTYANNAPLNGYKYMFGEGGLRVPLLMSLPGVIPVDVQSSSLVSAMDIAPTLLELAGVPVPGSLDGKSLLPLFKNPDAPQHDILVWDQGSKGQPGSSGQMVAVRSGDWKLVLSPGWTHADYALDQNGVASSAPEYHYPAGTLLFNLIDDIGETANVADQHPETVITLKKKFDRWRLQMEMPVGIGQKQRKYQAWLDRNMTQKESGISAGVLFRVDAASKQVFDGPDLAGKEFSLSACVQGDPSAHGVILAHGGRFSGYALYVENGKPTFLLRNGGKLYRVRATTPLHAASVQLTVHVSVDSILLLQDGLEIASASGMLLENNPQEGVSVGFDYVKKTPQSCVGDWAGENPFSGTIETVEIYPFEKGSKK